MATYGQASIGFEHKMGTTLTNVSGAWLCDTSGIYGIRETVSKTVLVPASTIVSGQVTGIYSYNGNGGGIYSLSGYDPNLGYDYAFRIIQTAGSRIEWVGSFPAASPGTITLGDIFNRVNFYLKKENKFFTSGEIFTIIGEDSFRRVAEDVDFPKANYSSFLSSGEWKITIPADFLKVDQNKDVVYKNGNTTIKLANKKQTNIGRDQILNATPGTPSNYFMESENVIGVYPPSTSGCIVIPYVKVPQTLSVDTDTNELTEKCYQAAVYWTVWQCMLKDSDEKTVIYEKLYNGEISRLKRRYGEMFEEDSDLVPHPSYLK